MSEKQAKKRHRKEKRGEGIHPNEDHTSGYGMDAESDTRWAEHFKLTVPLRMLSLYERGGITRHDLLEAHISIERVGATLDRFLRSSTKEGETADLLNRVAKSIAVLSYMPGGVYIFRQLYDARSFLAGIIGEDAAKAHVTDALRRCFAEKPISQNLLAEIVRAEVENAVAGDEGKPRRNRGSE